MFKTSSRIVFPLVAAALMATTTSGGATTSKKQRVWHWPLDEVHYGQDKIVQDYGQWGGIPDHPAHHTGLDIGTEPNTPLVMAAADGYIVKLVPLDIRGSNCKGMTPNCADHGFGNTIIIKHPDRANHMFSQYSHMSSFNIDIQKEIETSGKCTKFDGYEQGGKVYLNEWRCPDSGSNAIHVDSGDPLGNAGRSGFGDPNGWPANHLHIEIKSVNSIYSEDPDDTQDGFSFGYSAAFPGTLDYLGPVHYFQKHIKNKHELPVKITDSGDGVSLRLGPAKKYTLALTAKSGQTFWASKSLRKTSDCPLGWYKIAKTAVWPPEGSDGDEPNSTTYFSPTNSQLKPGLLAATWVCRGLNSNDPWVIP